MKRKYRSGRQISGVVIAKIPYPHLHVEWSSISLAIAGAAQVVMT